MKRNLLFSISGFGVILTSLLLLASFQSAATVAAASLPASDISGATDTLINPELRYFERFRADKAATSKATIVYALDPADIELFSAVHASPTTVTADQARWDALGEFYLSQAGARSAKAITADQARWDALGEFYLSQAGAHSAEAITADQARWDALGEFYSSQAGARSAEAITADQARWDALGKFYTSQAINYVPAP